MEQAFSLAAEIDALIDLREKGYSNHANDSGGETNHGVTVFVARAFGYHGRMQDMQRSVAVAIYERRYWYGPKFHEVCDLSAPIAKELFDTGVNCGTGVAVQFLQQWLNAFNLRGQYWPDMLVDGRVGEFTLHALRTYLAMRTPEGEQIMVAALNGSQAEYYRAISQQRPKDEDFVYGQLRHRVANR
jgi:lysozyme family protein